LAVNCYVEPVYTLDADIVVVYSMLSDLETHLEAQGARMRATMREETLPSFSDGRLTPSRSCARFLEESVFKTEIRVPPRLSPSNNL
jgi:hypothetical protein